MFGGRTGYYNNTVDYRPLLRAALTNLHTWVTDDAQPPQSRYPRLDDGTLIDGHAFRDHMTQLPGPGFPARSLYPTAHLDYGPSLVSDGHVTRLPPDVGPAYRELMPAVDDDGNFVAGVRHPDVEVPLATYTGWNPRHPSIGGADMTVLLNGATIPFARTAADRAALSDSRPSIAERWPSVAEYLDHVRAAAKALVAEGYLLEEDIEPVVDTARQKYEHFTQLESPLPQPGGETAILATR
jgi:hypothetical protein